MEPRGIGYFFEVEFVPEEDHFDYFPLETMTGTIVLDLDDVTCIAKGRIFNDARFADNTNIITSRVDRIDWDNKTFTTKNNTYSFVLLKSEYCKFLEDYIALLEQWRNFDKHVDAHSPVTDEAPLVADAAGE